MNAIEITDANKNNDNIKDLFDISNNVYTLKSLGGNNVLKTFSIDISNTVVIGNNAFNGFTNLTKVTLGNSVITIGEGAFRYCSSLPS